MYARLVLGVVYTLIVAEAVEGTEESDAVYRKIQKLYDQTSPDSMRCWFHIHGDTKKKCAEETKALLRELMDTVKSAEAAHIIKAKTKCGEKRKGYADYFIGEQYNGNVEIPCDEHAFDAPKHTQKEVDDMNYKLKALWNKYESMCFQKFSKVNCDEQKWNRGQELAKMIQYAEKEEFIAPNCQEDGIGSYSFTQGMDPTDMPCRPMPEGTKYGDKGTIKQS